MRRRWIRCLFMWVGLAVGGFRSVSAHDAPISTALQNTEALSPTASTEAPGGPASAAQEQASLAGPTVAAFQRVSPRVAARILGTQLVVESDGLPDHPMMVGIRSWQQQIPLPQPYTGTNAWRLPLNPQMSDNPLSVLKEPLRGAIALAVNGVPIFCALNNRGDDAYLAGELDEWGGHCGRGDDYHYHIAPVHLEEFVGAGQPIAYALDGYPILGYTEADGSLPVNLDEFNGHRDAAGHYHYHATRTFPYINGGLMGVVTMAGDQIEQPRDAPIRPPQSPLQGATITDFDRTDNRFKLTYKIAGKAGQVAYSVADSGRVEFEQVSPSGESTSAVYQLGKSSRPPAVRSPLFAMLVIAGLLVGGGLVWRLTRSAKRTAAGNGS